MRNVNFAKKTVSVLVLLLFAAGAVFAEGDDETSFPRNTVTLDPQVFYLLYDVISLAISENEPSYAFGIAAQYERQFTPKMSAVGRFEYGMMHVLSWWDVHSFSAEGRFRYYPLRGVFFLEAMLGYANILSHETWDGREANSTVHYFKYGGKVGWRIDFGEPGGFVLEPGIGLNGVAGKKLRSSVEDEDPSFGGLFSMLQDSLAVGMLLGDFRFYLGLGYRF